MIADYLQSSRNLLEGVVSHHALKLVRHDRSAMGEWFVYYENSEFVLGIGRDRGGHISIDLGSKIRRKARAHMRGPWSMSHLKGYLGEGKDHFNFKSINDEISWLEENKMALFDSSLLNSDALNQWSVKASRRLFGQDSK